MTVIFDYGAGNLRSVENMLGALGAGYEFARDADGLRRADRIILPGVGHFGQMMRALDRLGVRGALIERLRAGVPFLGICLGMQALFERSAEAPDVPGLGLFSGSVERFAPGIRAPHMGWNKLELCGSPVLLRGLGEHPYVYFAHSYYVPEQAAGSRAAALVKYHITYAAAVEAGNVFGVQFHPEKSGAAGQRILANFLGGRF
ncbi:MAG TPA: imidazole glycerol phosphate synthase subunit HisH [Bryobacterales bacterium]|jgi:imidazole glycerol phosphate synthase glutamine amidotransferase subunit|nr:imidazole glycerol phosphate synthase subunit HisH [Bryobacterales bacterium]